MPEGIHVRDYIDPSGKNIIRDWLTALADMRARAKVAMRINRLAAGNLGD